MRRIHPIVLLEFHAAMITRIACRNREFFLWLASVHRAIVSFGRIGRNRNDLPYPRTGSSPSLALVDVRSGPEPPGIFAGSMRIGCTGRLPTSSANSRSTAMRIQERPAPVAHCDDHSDYSCDESKDRTIILEMGGVVQVGSPAQIVSKADGPSGREASR